ncbi:hypothetical protein KAI32_00265 [Candidatus Pacearchaeota archaeon]|nr:hypothetical protein [Candidatus Pacearchaeota archaeon]
MVISKHAQVFLLAAVIISAIVISLGITANQAIVNSEPRNFQDFSYEVTREIGAVIDYEIYTNFSEDDNLEDFVNTLAENIQDDNPDDNFAIIYRDEEGITVETYNPKKPKKDSTISIGKFQKKINRFIDKITEETLDEEDLEGVEGIVIVIEDEEITLPLPKYKQVIFFMQKDVGDESFVTSR